MAEADCFDRECSMYRMDMLEFGSRRFDYDCVSLLFCTKKYSKNCNNFKNFTLQEKDWVIAKLIGLNSEKAKKSSKIDQWSTQWPICVCMDSKVLVAKKLKQAANLVNGSIGFVKEMIWAENETLSSNLPIYFLSDFGDR